MSIVDTTISTAIKSFLDNTSKEEDIEKAKQKFCDDLAKVISDAIKSATVTIPTGAVVVATAGSPSAQTGSNTAPAIGSLS